MNETETDQLPDGSPSTPSGSEIPNSGAAKDKKPLNLVSAFLGNCLCEPFQFVERTRGQSVQFVELHSVKFIGLGAVEDELTPRERVYDTLQQLTTRPERLISIGYLLDEPQNGVESSSNGEVRKATEAIPLDIWNQNYPNDQSMSKEVKKTILQIKVRTISFLFLKSPSATSILTSLSLTSEQGIRFYHGRDDQDTSCTNGTSQPKKQ
jgi:hypothetical protein